MHLMVLRMYSCAQGKVSVQYENGLMCVIVLLRTERKVVTLESLIALPAGRGRMSGLWMTTER